MHKEIKKQNQLDSEKLILAEFKIENNNRKMIDIY